MQILVSGRASGVGLATLRTLGDEGQEVIVMDRDSAKLAAVEGMARVTPVAGSVADKADCLRAAARGADRPGGSPQEVKA